MTAAFWNEHAQGRPPLGQRGIIESMPLGGKRLHHHGGGVCWLFVLLWIDLWRHKLIVCKKWYKNNPKEGLCGVTFCPALACTTPTAANGHGSPILNRLHYVRAKAKEAHDTSKSHHSDNRWKQGQSNWFNWHTSKGYSMFEQFRNGYYYHMP